MKSRLFSLRFKLLFALTAVGVLTAALVCYQVYKSAAKTIYDERLSTLFLLQRSKAEHIRLILREQESNLHYFAENDDTVAMLHSLTKSYEKLAPLVTNRCKTEVARYYQDLFTPAKLTYAYNQYIPTDPKTLAMQCMQMALERGASASSVSAYASELKNAASHFTPFIDMNNFDGLLLVNSQGTAVFSTRLVDLGIDLNNELWQGSVPAVAFRHAKSSENESRIYDYAFYMPAGYKARAFIAARIAEGGQFQGVLIATFSPRFLDALLYENATDNTLEMFLIGKDYTMRSGSRLSLRNFEEYMRQQQELNPIIAEKMLYAHSPVLLQTVNREIAQRLISKDPRVNTGTITTKNYMNQEMLIAFSPLNLPYSLDWGIVAEIPPGEFTLYIKTLKSEIMAAASIALIIIISATAIVSRAISTPIKRFAVAARGIALGDYDKRFNDPSKDELGELAASFDELSEALHKQREELKKANDSFIDEVNERMQTELALERERAFASDIIDSQAVLLIIVDRQGAIVHTNHMLEKLSGYRKEELAERAPTLLFDGETAERYTEAMEVSVAGRTQNFTAPLFTKDGAARIIDWYISVMATLTEFTILTGIDVTEQKNVEERLKGNESMIEFLTNSAQDAIFISDEHGLIISWNIAAEKMYGYKMEDILLQPVAPTLIDTKYKEQFINKNYQAERKGKTIEVSSKRKNKEAFHAEVSMSLINFGTDANTMFVVRDISARIQRERELKHALDTAKNAEKAKADFLANMSHEIRTPMNGIIGFLELLKQTRLDTTQGEYLKIINSSADSLLSIINEILDFSKLESGKMQIEKVEFNVFEELENVGELYAAKAGEKGIELLIDVDTLIPAFLVGDPLRIRQILANLLSNAIKFTPERGRIVISAEFLDNKESCCLLRFAVKDTGIGISKDKQETIFDAFSQADSSVTRKYGGTGLGLAISSKFTRLMGSNLTLESTEGEGSVFSFVLSLPVGKADMSKDLFNAYKVGILNVGMSAEVCRLLRRYLDYLGCVVTDYGRTAELADSSDELLFTSPRAAVVEGVAETFKHTLCVVAQETDNAFIGENLAGAKTLYKPVHTSKLLNLLNDLTKGGAKVQQQGAERSFKGRVLVAEDNPVNQQLINIILTKMGLEVVMCGNGQEATDLAIDRFDIIFMDIHMPVMNGIDATKKIIEREQAEGRTHAPIIALTANVVEENQATYTEAGMDGFLAKPLVLHELVLYLEKYLEERALPAEDFFKAKAKELEIDDVEMIKMIVGEFVKQSEGQADKAEERLLCGDIEGAVKEIHNIKNSAISLRFTRIDTILTRLLELIAGGDKDSALYQLGILKSEVAKIVVGKAA